MPSYFLPYPKGKPQHGIKYKPSPLQTTQVKAEKQPYPHPQPDSPNNPPSPLNLSATSASASPSSSPNFNTSASTTPSVPISNQSSSPSSSSSSSSSTIKPSSATHRRHNDYNPSSLNLQLVFGNPHDPSLVVVFGLRFREGRRPKVKFSVKRGHGRVRGLEDVLGVGGYGEENNGEGRRKETGEESGERDGRIRGKARDGEGRSRGKKRKRESEN
jgi:hypothetical protein